MSSRRFVGLGLLVAVVLARVLGEHAGHRDRGGSAAGTDLGEVDDVLLAQLRVGLAGVAVQREMIGTGGLADHEHQQRFLLSLQRSRRLAGVQADRLDHQVLLDHQALLGVLAHRIDVVGRVDEVGQLVFLAEDQGVGGIEAAYHYRDDQQAAEQRQDLVQQAAEERPVAYRPEPDQQRRQDTEQQQIAEQGRVDQVAGLGGVGLEDVLHHHRVDADAVAAHEVGRAGRAQGDQGQGRLEQRAEGNQGQQEREGGPQERRERGEEREALQALQRHQAMQGLPGRRVVEHHQNQREQHHQPGRTDSRQETLDTPTH